MFGRSDAEEPSDVSSAVERAFATEWPQVVATLRADVASLDAAEELAQAAFETALVDWERSGVPNRPGAWLITVARRRAIDQARRGARFADRRPELERRARLPEVDVAAGGDPQLAMIFGCCHRSLDRSTQVALTLRYVCGLTTAQIAHAFVVAEPTMAKRLVRAKHKIATAGVPFEVPAGDRLRESLDAVLAVIYLIFNEGYASTTTPHLVRGDLVDEATWLAAHLARLLPDEPEPLGLVALIAFTDARRAARLDADGDLVLLDDQDRSTWDRSLIEHGHRTLEDALKMMRHGPYQLQAAIAATHASAERFDDTRWEVIADLYARLYRQTGSPIVQLNGAVAVAMVDGPQAGLDMLTALDDDLDGYHYLHAARADLHRRLGRTSAARSSYRRAVELCQSEPERRYLTRRLESL